MGVACKSIINNLSGFCCTASKNYSDNLHIFINCVIDLIDIDTIILNLLVSQRVMTF